MIATIIILVFMGIQTGVELASHGEIQERRYNIWARLIANIIVLTLYYYAGLFDKFK